MPQFTRGDTSIYYEEHGTGFPLLLIAPGGMNSTIQWWDRAAFNPLTLYSQDFRIIAMDQRNAGRSTGPLDMTDPWGSFVEDQLGLMDHLGIERFHAMGCCIGCSYVLKLIECAPGRMTAGVLEQPIGIVDDNRPLLANAWREWGKQLAEQRADIDSQAVETFGRQMWEGEFVLSVSREFVRSCTTPLLVLPGVDQFHPAETGREVAALAPKAEVMEPWKDTPELIAESVERVRRFLKDNTPA